jgi:hypothetical protein
LVYLGFIIVNLELIEIFVDGLFGTHRFLAGVLGLGFYNVFTAVLEVMAFLVAVSIAIFFIRRNIVHIRRLNMKELLGWPKNDANWILVIICSDDGFLFNEFIRLCIDDKRRRC